ncbi:MAG: DUF3857 and transglutaminase domain-containing protein [bacterium]|nr:DUF3857 and transglutaminase domain-containing protein [bacterium]
MHLQHGWTTRWIHHLCPLLIIFLSSPIIAGPSWIKDALADESSMTIDPEATHLVLRHTEATKIKRDGTAETHVQVAYRVLRTAGIEEMVFVELVGPWHKIRNQKGWHIAPGGAEETLLPEKFATFAPPGDIGIHTDLRMMVGSFDKVKIGSVVAFEFDRLEEHDWAGTFQRFIFQHQQPVLFTQWTLQLPSDWHMQATGKFTDSLQFDSTAGNIIWTGSRLPYRPEEPLMPPWYYMDRVVQVNCYTTAPGTKTSSFPDWKTASHWLDSLHYWQGQPTAELTEFVKSILPEDTALIPRLKAIASFVQNEIRYVAIEIGKGAIVPRHAHETYKNRYGDCKDKVALMRAMLASIGVPSTTVLTGVKTWVSEQISSPFQFDHCILAIPDSVFGDSTVFPLARAGEWLIFDPTYPAAPFGFLPIGEYGNSILIASEKDTSLTWLRDLEPEQNSRKIVATATLAEDGSLTAQVRSTAYGDLAAAMKYKNGATSQREQIDEILKSVTESVPGATITDYVASSDNDSTWVTFTLLGKNYLQRSGELSILKLDFLWSGEVAAFRKNERMYPIWFGAPRKTDSRITWVLPTGWEAETLDSIGAQCRIATVAAWVKQDPSGLIYESVSEKNGEIMEASEYAEARAFRRLFERISTLKTIVRPRKG